MYPLAAALALLALYPAAASQCGYGARQPASTEDPSPSCLAGLWYFPPEPSTRITFSISSTTPAAVSYNISATGTLWSSATATFPIGAASFTITFDERPPLTMPGFPDADCASISWAGLSPLWCRNASGCATPINPFWAAGAVHLVEVSHSDIGWLGAGGDSWGPGLPDLIDDTRNIGIALDMMAVDPTFVWQHECILFMRCFVEMYPEREGELLGRIAEGRFDIGATFSEPLESTLLNELLARQMYTGRKWFVERYPGVESADVAFHQDGPLRALQVPQLYRKAGVRYIKSSRWSDNIQSYCGADDESCLLSFTEVHYGERDCTVADLSANLNDFFPKYAAAGLPPQAIQALGTDYAPPTNMSQFMHSWASQAAPHPAMRYSTFHTALKALDVHAPNLRRVKGERPNLWYIEGCPPHHNMCTYLREGARALPASELWSVFSSLALTPGSWSSYPAAELSEAWLNLTLTDHGIAGEPTPRNFSSLPRWFINENSPPQWDMAYAEKWSRARDMGNLLSATARDAIAGALAPSAWPQGATHSFSVFNDLSWAREGPVEVVLLAGQNCSGFSIVDAAGAAVPSQPTDQQWEGQCALAFLAKAVPPLGYATFFLVPASSPPPPAQPGAPAPSAPWTQPFSNAFYKITPGLGGIASLVHLASGLEVFNTSIYNAGEWMALEYTGMGASETRSYDHAVRGAAFSKLSDFPSATWTCMEAGAVRTVFAIAPTATAHSSVSLILIAYADQPRLDLRLRLANWDSAYGVANRLAFPLATAARNVSYSVPFGVVRVGSDEAENRTDDVWLTNPGPEVEPFERGWAMHPREIADWMAAEGGGEGDIGLLISSSVGTFDWVDCSGAYPDTSVVLAPELMLHTNSNRGPYLPEPGNHSFAFSLVPLPPGEGGWRASWRRGVESNNPLRATAPAAAGGGGGQLPPSASLLTVANDGGASWVTAVKKQDDGVSEERSGVVLRMFNVDGVDRNVSIALALPNATLKAVFACDLIELNQKEMEMNASSGSFVLQLGHWAVETVLLTVAAA